MRTSTFTKATVSILVGVAIAPVAPAAAQDGTTTPDRAGAAVERPHRDQVVTRRDGSRAVPFVAQVGPSAAVPAEEGFDWGDAAIGAAGAYVLILLASGAVVLIRRRRPPRRLAQRPA
jgi:uncharacterized iron-regulated membrane protein